jgi:hypothetical protein
MPCLAMYINSWFVSRRPVVGKLEAQQGQQEHDSFQGCTWPTGPAEPAALSCHVQRLAPLV